MPARTGKVAIVGRPNVGKSTLLNALIGEHLSITSRKPQTTRNRILGVLTRGEPPASTQFIFVDTPGFQQRRGAADARRMNDAVVAALSDVDAIVLVIDAAGWRPDDEAVLQLLGHAIGRVVLALNKIDLLSRYENVLPVLRESATRFDFAALVPVSAEKRTQLDSLLAEVEKLLPTGEPLFGPDEYTDRSARFVAAELIREKAFRLLGDELPYGIAVTIERWDENEARADIAAGLLVERESHRPIVIGAQGAKLREIGRLARADIAQMLGKTVHLETWVRVRRKHAAETRTLEAFGYE